MLSTKKPKPEAYLQLTDLSEWQACLAAGREIDAVLAKADAARRAVDGACHKDEREGRVDGLARDILARAAGQPAVETDSAVARIREEYDAAKMAKDLHTRQRETLERDLRATVVYPSWRDAHVDALRKIAAAIVALREAVDTEQVLCNQMTAAGAFSPTEAAFGHHPWVNCAACAALPGAIRRMDLRSFRQCNRDLLK